MVTGRISLFKVVPREGESNPPCFKGVITYLDGSEDRVTLWENVHPRVTGGVFYSGQLYQEDD